MLDVPEVKKDFGSFLCLLLFLLDTQYLGEFP